MDEDEFFEEVSQFWISAIEDVAGRNPPVSGTWRGVDEIRKVLKPFMAKGKNHGHLPTRGGHDLLDVRSSTEADCLEFKIGKRFASVFKPKSLTLEYFPESPINSFILLELSDLQLSGIYESFEGKFEELVELAPGEYEKFEVWDAGFCGHDENGNEIPLPTESRIVARFLKGKFLIVAKGSIWNGTSKCYDGRHNQMNSSEIRAFIKNALNSRSSL